MQKFYAVLALAAAFIPSSLLAQSAHRFTQDGRTYTYTIKPAAHGRQVIEGHSQPSGSGFRLVVDGDHVDGVSGGQPVSFRTPTTKGALIAAR